MPPIQFKRLVRPSGSSVDHADTVWSPQYEMLQIETLNNSTCLQVTSLELNILTIQ